MTLGEKYILKLRALIEQSLVVYKRKLSRTERYLTELNERIVKTQQEIDDLNKKIETAEQMREELNILESIGND